MIDSFIIDQFVLPSTTGKTGMYALLHPFKWCYGSVDAIFPITYIKFPTFLFVNKIDADRCSDAKIRSYLKCTNCKLPRILISIGPRGPQFSSIGKLHRNIRKKEHTINWKC